jgi:hypothetical protein
MTFPFISQKMVPGEGFPSLGDTCNVDNAVRRLVLRDIRHMSYGAKERERRKETEKREFPFFGG